MRPRLQAETSVEARSTVWRTPFAAWTVTTAKQFVVLDDRLEPVASFPVPADWSGLHAVTPDAAGAVLSLPDRLALVDGQGYPAWQRPHRPWPEGCSGSTWVTPDGLVWAVIPGHEGPGAPDRCWVLALADGALLAELVLDVASSGSEPIGMPAGPPGNGLLDGPPGNGLLDGVLLGVSAAGGDGSRIYLGGRDARGVRMLRMPDPDRTLADVHPRGDRYLSIDRHHEDVAVHAASDGRVLVRRTAQDVFGPDELVDFQGAFVSDRLVVLRSVLEQQHLVVDAENLSVAGPVEYPDGAARDAVLPAGDGRWVTTDWLDGRLQLWSL